MRDKVDCSSVPDLTDDIGFHGLGFNLFKGAYFGKPYKTRDGRKALYCYKFTDNSHALIVEGDEEFWYVRDDGLVDDFDDSFMDESYYTDKDIVSEW